MRRVLTGALLAAALVGGVLALPAPAAAQTAGGDGLAGVATTRYGGADRYATSLLAAEAVAADAGGSLSHVVMVSGRSWPDAVVAAPVAGALGAPVLMTPPGALRDDAAAFLARTGVTDVVVVGATSGANAVGDAVVTALEGAGITVKRVGRADRYATGVVAAREISAVGEMPGFGTTAIIANGDVFADALVAGPFAARGLHPVLLTPRDRLHPGVAGYLSDAGIEHVVLMGGPAALSEAVDWSISSAGIAVTRLAGATRFDTAVKAAQLVEGRYAQGSEPCFTSERIGLARARVPFDSFSAGPLLGRLCAPLLLASPHVIPPDTAGFLDAARTATAAAGTAAIDLRVFGGDAAVSEAAINAYLNPAPADEPAGLPAGTCGGPIDGAPVQLVATDDPEEPAWSPDCSQIVYGARSRLWIAGADGSNPTELTQRDGGYSREPSWSPDGTQVAYVRQVFQDPHWESHIWVVNADGTGKRQLTRGDVWDNDPAWSPDGIKLVFSRISGSGRNDDGSRIDSDRYVTAMNADGTSTQFLTVGGNWDHSPVWSPDGRQIAYIAYNTVLVQDVNRPNARAVASNAYWDGGLTWSPDGTKIAFTRRDGDEASIRIVQIDTASEEVLADTPGQESYPRWSPDGQRILYYTTAEDGSRQAWAAGASGRQVGIAPGKLLWRGSAPSAGGCGGTMTDPSQQLGPRGAISPSWSPDCSHILFAHVGSLWLMRNDGTDLRRLTHFDARTQGSAELSPDGTRIALVRSRYADGHWESHIWLINADGTGLTQLTDGDVWDDKPSWSPDGTRLAFSRQWGGPRDADGDRAGHDRYIAVMGIDGSGRLALSAGGAWDNFPAWSPDGSEIVFVGSDGVVRAASPDGGALRRVAAGVHNDVGLAWSPDGSQIAFARQSTVDSDPNKPGALVAVAVDGISEAVLADEVAAGTRPRWSPDGQRVAYGGVGVDVGTGDQRVVRVTGATGTAIVSAAAQCRPRGLSHTTAGFPLPSWAALAQGTVRVAVLFVDFPDAEAAHTTEEEAALSLAWAEEFLEKSSFGKLDVEFVPHPGWLRAPKSYTEYLEKSVLDDQRVTADSIYEDAVGLVDDQVDFSGYHSLAVILPSTHFTAGSAGGFVEADGVSLPRHINNNRHRDEPAEIANWGYTAAHELMHNLGLLDMYAYDAELHALPELDVDDNVWVTVDMGLMGLHGYFVADSQDRRLEHEWRHTNGTRSTSYDWYLEPREMLAWSRWQLGWLTDAQVSCVTDDEATVRLWALASPGNHTAMAAIPLNRHEVIVVESRRQLGYDAPEDYTASNGATTARPTLITPGVVVYTVDSFIGSGQLAVKFAGDSGNGQIEDFPTLGVGDSVTLRGYTITVTAGDNDTHSISITRAS